VTCILVAGLVLGTTQFLLLFVLSEDTLGSWLLIVLVALCR